MKNYINNLYNKKLILLPKNKKFFTADELLPSEMNPKDYMIDFIMDYYIILGVNTLRYNLDKPIFCNSKQFNTNYSGFRGTPESLINVYGKGTTIYNKYSTQHYYGRALDIRTYDDALIIYFYILFNSKFFFNNGIKRLEDINLTYNNDNILRSWVHLDSRVYADAEDISVITLDKRINRKDYLVDFFKSNLKPFSSSPALPYIVDYYNNNTLKILEQ